ncbi:MAG: riboflavin biosynthesis protein RibF [Endomicrobium sp.]|nr:riboflavin biosynthesis protein RibF [Endomicrobium sp.]
MTTKSIITIGTFDGLHKGHRFLISKTLFGAKKNNFKSIVIVLEKPVRKVNGLLTTFEEKLEAIKSLGMDEIFVIEVPSEVLLCTPDEFFDEFLRDTLNVSEIICGSTFAFGKNREGDISWLERKAKNSNVKVNIIKPLKHASKKISSSQIRMLIEKGDLKKAEKLLGGKYYFTGMPFKENGMGKQLGCPTVNLQVDSGKLLPKGVFLSLVSQGERIYPSITNIGARVTFNRGNSIIPETHILDFQGVWKKSKTKVALLKKIRNEKNFATVELLKAQVFKDILMASKFFNKDG